MNPPDLLPPLEAEGATRGASAGARRFASRRVLWHTLGLLAAVLVAWLILRGYRQPEFILDFAAFRLC